MRRANSFHKYRAFYHEGELKIGKAYVLDNDRAYLITDITNEYIYAKYGTVNNRKHSIQAYFNDSFENIVMQEISKEEFYTKYGYTLKVD